MAWRDFFSMGLDKTLLDDWAQKVYDPAQLKRKFAYHAVMMLVVAPWGILLLAHYIPRHFSFTPFPIPIVVMLLLCFGNLRYAYRLRNRELAGEEVTDADKLWGLKWRFAPGVGFVLSGLGGCSETP